jgi:membrane protease YdiL (CAAX protease family)
MINMSSGRSRHYYRPEDMGESASGSYKVDIVAIVSFFTAMILMFFLDYTFQMAQLSGTPSDLMTSSGFLVFFLLLLGGAVGVVILVVYSLQKGDNKLVFDFDVDPKEIAMTIAAGLTFAGAIGVLYTLCNVFLGGLSFNPNTSLIIVAQGLQPIGEEFASRGAIYGFMDRVLPGGELWKFPLKSGPSAIEFYLNHFWAYSFSPGVTVFLVGSGFILSFGYWYYRKLGVPIVAHWSWNIANLLRLILG